MGKVLIIYHGGYLAGKEITYFFTNAPKPAELIILMYWKEELMEYESWGPFEKEVQINRINQDDTYTVPKITDGLHRLKITEIRVVGTTEVELLVQDEEEEILERKNLNLNKDSDKALYSLFYNDPDEITSVGIIDNIEAYAQVYHNDLGDIELYDIGIIHRSRIQRPLEVSYVDFSEEDEELPFL